VDNGAKLSGLKILSSYSWRALSTDLRAVSPEIQSCDSITFLKASLLWEKAFQLKYPTHKEGTRIPKRKMMTIFRRVHIPWVKIFM
jgi:hypothetical protein